MLCGDECESVSHTLWDCSAYTSIRAQFLVKLKASLGGSYARTCCNNGYLTVVCVGWYMIRECILLKVIDMDGVIGRDYFN